jgi:hypothetical protein
MASQAHPGSCQCWPVPLSEYRCGFRSERLQRQGRKADCLALPRWPLVRRTARSGCRSWRTAVSARLASPTGSRRSGCSGMTCCRQRAPAGRTGWSVGHRRGCPECGGELVQPRLPGRWWGRQARNRQLRAAAKAKAPALRRQRAPRGEQAPRGERVPRQVAGGSARAGQRHLRGQESSPQHRPDPQHRDPVQYSRHGSGCPDHGGQAPRPARWWWSAACLRSVPPSSRRRRACPTRCLASPRCRQSGCRGLAVSGLLRARAPLSGGG